MKDHFSEKICKYVDTGNIPTFNIFFKIEPVGDKRLKWTPEEPIECPTEVCLINKTNYADICLLFI